MINLVKTIWLLLCVLLISFGSIGIYKTVQTKLDTEQENVCRQPGSYFYQNEERLILVDAATQYIGGEKYNCKIFADKYLLTMYLYIEHGVGENKTATMTTLVYADGYPMVYDDEELLDELSSGDSATNSDVVRGEKNE